jgi:serine/threonine-protein kinase
MTDERRAPRPAPPLPPRPPSLSDAGPRSGPVPVSAQSPDRSGFTPAPSSPAAPPHVSSADITQPAPIARKFDPYVGTVIDGRYIVEDVIGEGGMGVVYRGRHKMIEKRVAIKVLRNDMAKEPEITERFLQEARAASAIGNPHIIDISDFGQLADGSTYFVMEFLDGKSLGDIVNQKKPLGVPRLCHIGKQIAQGLSAAHAASIIHRDLKPDNIMLVTRGTEKDFAKILDFGIAKVGSAATKMTKAGSVFGTPHYMSPEQAAGAVVDHRTDVYALGVILYELAAGKVPFDADNFMGILTQHMYKAPVPIRALVPEIDVPPGLDAVILKALTKKPEGRYANMDELLADLEKLEKGLLPDAVQEMMARSGGFNVPADYFRASAMPAPVPATPAGVPSRKRWPLYAAIAAVASAVGVVGVVMISRGPDSRGTAAATTATAVATAPPATTQTQGAGVATMAPTETAPPVKTTKVLVGIVPADAAIKRDGKDLGAPPVELDLADGEVASLTIARDGYDTKTVQVKAAGGARQNFTLTKTVAIPQGGARPPSGGGARPPGNNPFTAPGANTGSDPFAHP